MLLDVVVHPRFGDTVRVGADEMCRPLLVADIGTGGSLSIQVDGEPGSVELAARFARELAAMALRFAQRCEDLMPEATVTEWVPAADRASGRNR